MVEIFEALKAAAKDVLLFSEGGGGLRLRQYQREVAQVVIDSVLEHRGLSIVVIFPRQSGKNELQAQIEAFLLLLFSEKRGELVKISPTWKPQSQNAMQRLERVLRGNEFTRKLWSKEQGYVYKIGDARITFLSGQPEAHSTSVLTPSIT